MPWPWCLFIVPTHCVFRICSGIFCNAYLVVMNCFSLWLCSMSLLFYSSQRITFLVVAFWVVSFFFEVLTYIIHLLNFRVPVWRSDAICCVWLCKWAGKFLLQLSSFVFVFFCFTSDILTAVHHEVFAWAYLLGVLNAFCAWMCVSFLRFETNFCLFLWVLNYFVRCWFASSF